MHPVLPQSSCSGLLGTDILSFQTLFCFSDDVLVTQHCEQHSYVMVVGVIVRFPCCNTVQGGITLAGYVSSDLGQIRAV